VLFLNFPVIYAIINIRAAGPTDKPLISFFQAKKERVKSFFSANRLSLFISWIASNAKEGYSERKCFR